MAQLKGKMLYKHLIKPGAYATMSNILINGSINGTTIKDGAACCITDVLPLENAVKANYLHNYLEDRIFRVHVLGTEMGIESYILRSLLADLPEEKWVILH